MGADTYDGIKARSVPLKCLVRQWLLFDWMFSMLSFERETGSTGPIASVAGLICDKQCSSAVMMTIHDVDRGYDDHP